MIYLGKIKMKNLFMLKNLLITLMFILSIISLDNSNFLDTLLFSSILLILNILLWSDLIFEILVDNEINISHLKYQKIAIFILTFTISGIILVPFSKDPDNLSRIKDIINVLIATTVLYNILIIIFCEKIHDKKD
jgi:hypothetical protein